MREILADQRKLREERLAKYRVEKDAVDVAGASLKAARETFKSARDIYIAAKASLEAKLAQMA